MPAEKELNEDRIATIVRDALKHAENEAWESAWDVAAPLVEGQKEHRRAAEALVYLLNRGAFDRERGLEAATELFASHSEDATLVGELGEALECVHDIRFLNGPPADDPLFLRVAERLRGALEAPGSREEEIAMLHGLGTAARLLGRSWDDTAERAHQRLIELQPERWQAHYDLGLLYKTRGRFADGQAANQRAYDLGGPDHEDVVWNLGICATGAGDGAVALPLWKAMGQKIELGRWNLPEGRYPMAKVRLAERPIAERAPENAPDDPGLEETIWIERLSPCHGIVRSALYYDAIGVDFGDVVLFDGAPITYHSYGDQQVAVFPHLATLVHADYRIHHFAGTQGADRQIADLSEHLPLDAVIYVHTEQFRELCAACWENPDVDHAEHRSAEHRVVSGKLCAPPSLEAHELREALDGVLHDSPDVKLFVPDLTRAAGDLSRAETERRRMEMLESS